MGNTNISTNVHQLGMTLMWTGVSTVMLMAILLRDYSKAWLVHAILGSLILLVTFTFMLLFLIPLPFPPEGQGTLVYVHGILGATIITFIGFQVFGGFYGLWFQRQRQNNPQDIQNRKLGHKILGYIIMVILKINVLVMWVGYGYWQIALNWEFLGILTWVFLKMLRPKIVNGKTIMEKAPRVIGSLK